MSDTTIPLQARIAYIEARRPETVHATLDIRVISYDPVTVVVDVDSRLYQTVGIVHGGVFILMAESAASIQAALDVDISKFNVAGQAVEAHHLRRVRTGSLKAIPRLVHGGRSTRIYDVDVTDQDGAVVSTSRVTMAIRPWRDGEAPA